MAASWRTTAGPTPEPFPEYGFGIGLTAIDGESGPPVDERYALDDAERALDDNDFTVMFSADR